MKKKGIKEGCVRKLTRFFVDGGKKQGGYRHVFLGTLDQKSSRERSKS